MLDGDTHQVAYPAALLCTVWLLAVLALALGQPVLLPVVGLGVMAVIVTCQRWVFRAQDRHLAERRPG